MEKRIAELMNIMLPDSVDINVVEVGKQKIRRKTSNL
jgi:hypothetical protein